MRNTISLAGLLVIFTLLFNACKKEEGIGMDFKINGAKDLTLLKNDSITRDITFLYLGGSHDTFRITYPPPAPHTSPALHTEG